MYFTESIIIFLKTGAQIVVIACKTNNVEIEVIADGGVGRMRI